MSRRYLKIATHILYITALTYLIILKSKKIITIKKINRFMDDIKHILIWTKIPGIKYEGQKHFIKNKCDYINCYFTNNKTLFGDVRYFDAIVFNLQDVYSSKDYPEERGINQRYIFAANDSADNYPVCNPVYDSFFNWTWTYKIDSTIPYKFISVYNIYDEELGSHFQWMQNMKAIDLILKTQLVTKSKAAAVFLDKCKSRSLRENFIDKLKTELSKYNQTVDVFGECGVKCKRKTMAPCYWRLKKQYYFFLALEDSFAKDFLTKSVLNAYKYNAVPIVYGGAEYDKFLPPGSYLDAMKLKIDVLAKTILEAMNNKERYYEYFRWKNHYAIKDVQVLNPCSLCGNLNNPSWLVHKTVYTYFRNWWHPHFEERCGHQNKLFTL